MPRKPLIALVGRPNVGKSTLFNRLIGERRAIVEDLPGTTRDRHYADTEWNGLVFTLIDTGGLVLGGADEIIEQVRAQAQVAIDEADVIVFLVDIVDGLTGDDHAIADLLRRTAKPIILAVNKVDNLKRELNIHEFYALGLGDPLPVSASKGLNSGELLDQIVASLPRLVEEDEDAPEALHVALVGRTNVGKSSLINRFLGYERVIVSSTPGTTRDAVDTRILYHGQEIVLIDTAGIRRRGRIEGGVEKYSVLRALKAIARADVVLLLLDATEGVTAQDTHIAGYILEEAKSALVLVNKWDLVEKNSYTHAQYEEYVRRELKFMPYVPVMFISALTGQRVSQVLATALRIQQERTTRLSTAKINHIIREATVRRSPPTKGGKKLRIYYGTQVGVSPPTLVLFVNDRRLVHFGYRRYLENQIRARYPFEGTPIRLRFRDHAERE
ncbi:MAG: ribosome biogenesis GTPase Der [Anaerolineae bacterium]|nr:ribosome biogenesis GTPase Der [Anaerolineae bacterium]